MTVKGKNLRIAQELKKRILSGGYPVGSRLESLAALTKQFGTTVATMSRALDVLEHEGLIDRVNGLGVFVKGQVRRKFAVIFDSKAEMGLFAYKFVFMKYFIDYCHDNAYEYNVFEDIDTDRDCNRVRKFLCENAYDAVLISSRQFAAGCEKYLHGIPIAAIGLYPYKDLKTCIYYSAKEWAPEAYEYLINAGCRKIAVITNRDQIHLWQNPSIVTHQDIYMEWSKTHPDIFDPDFYCSVELSPRAGYQAACAILDKLPKDWKIGLVVTDSLLTHGVLSAVLQKQFRLWNNLFLVSQTLSGSNISLFSLPVISFSTDIRQSVTVIDSLIEGYLRTGKLEEGLIPIPGKLVFPGEI